MEFCPQGWRCQVSGCPKIHKRKRHHEGHEHGPRARDSREDKRSMIEKMSAMFNDFINPIEKKPVIEEPFVEKKVVFPEKKELSKQEELGELSELMKQHNINDEIYMMNQSLVSEGFTHHKSNLGVLKFTNGDLNKSEAILNRVEVKMEMKQSKDELKYNLAILKELGFKGKQYVKGVLLSNQNDLLKTIDALTKQNPVGPPNLAVLPQDSFLIIDALAASFENKHLSNILYSKDEMQCFTRFKTLLECTQDCWFVRPEAKHFKLEEEKKFRDSFVKSIPIGLTHNVNEVFAPPGQSVGDTILETFVELQGIKKQIVVVTNDEKCISQCQKIGPLTIMKGRMLFKNLKRRLPKGLAKTILGKRRD